VLEIGQQAQLRIDTPKVATARQKALRVIMYYARADALNISCMKLDNANEAGLFCTLGE